MRPTDSIRKVTIFIPALNEEDNIEATVNDLLPVAHATLDAFEVIMIDDGSTDKTGALMDTLASAHPELVVIHNPVPRGMGWGFLESLRRARYDYLTIVAGDHDADKEGLRQRFLAIGSAELILTYRTNQQDARPLPRVLLSRSYTATFNALAGCRIKDFTGGAVFPVAEVRALNIHSTGYAFQAEVLVKLLRRGISFVEIPGPLNAQAQARSQAIRWKILQDVLATLWHLCWAHSDVYTKARRTHGQTA